MSNNTITHSFFGKQSYFVLALLAAFPIWFIFNQYVKQIHMQEDEAVATAATVFFLLGIFTGRYIAQLIIPKTKLATNFYILCLVIIIVLAVGWLLIFSHVILIFWSCLAMLSLAFGILIKIVRSIAQKQIQAAQAAAAQSKSELHVLQSQLSPHFLFNTLNNLYGLSITEHEKVPNLLLKLSELLRYSVYETNEVFVPLKDELNYIDNYIEFEKIRIGDRLVLTTQIENIEGKNIKIAPMLLIVFIENAFKHSKNSAEQNIFININLKTWGNQLLFSIKNSQSKTKEESSVINKHSGFGLASVSKRLELLYGNDYELSYQNEATFYEVMLRLKIK
jgi:LytS/YehU family sensor histidine kinase